MDIGVVEEESAAPPVLLRSFDRVPVLTHWANVFRASGALVWIVAHKKSHSQEDNVLVCVTTRSMVGRLVECAKAVAEPPHSKTELLCGEVGVNGVEGAERVD